MNREILFKAKRIDNGEWIEGYLFQTKEYCFIFPKVTNGSYKISEKIMKFVNPCYEVDKDTICQYIGLTDKNGNKIFEGDILKGFEYPFLSNKPLSNEKEHNYFAEVVWFDNCPAFGLYTHKNPKSYVNGISEGNTEFMEGWESEMWEVIGNIFDNPELLK